MNDRKFVLVPVVSALTVCADAAVNGVLGTGGTTGREAAVMTVCCLASLLVIGLAVLASRPR